MSAAVTRRLPVTPMPALSLPRRLIAREAGVVWLVVAPVYLLTLAHTHREAADSLTFAANIRDGSAATLFVPYHPVYNWLGRGVWHLARAFGFSGGPLGPTQVMTALMGATGIALLWVVLRMAAPGRLAAMVGCGLLAASYGYWRYSTDLAVYVCAAVFLILALLAAYRAALAPVWQNFALLGVAGGLAVLGHITNVLFAAVALAALVIAQRTVPGVKVVRCGAAYAGAAVATVVPVYAVAITVVGLRTPHELYRWLTGYPSSGKWGEAGVRTLGKALMGSSRALVGGHFVFSTGRMRGLVTDHLPIQNPREEFYLVRDYPQAVALVLLVLAAVVGAALIVALAQWPRRPLPDRRALVLAALCLAWLAVYVPFFTWWEPNNIQFWVAPSVPVAVLAALALGAHRPGEVRVPRGLPVLAAVLVAGLVAVNLAGSVLPQAQSRNDYWRTRVAWYEQHAGPSDVVVATPYSWSSYLRYFSRAQVIDAEAAFDRHGYDRGRAVDEIRGRIAASGASRVLISDEAFHPSSDQYSRCPSAPPLCDIGVALREAFLGRSRVIAQAPLEQVWQVQDQPADPPTAPEPAAEQPHFRLLPPGSALPSGDECAARVRRQPWEPRPENALVNHTVPAGLSLPPWKGVDSRVNADVVPRIDGNFTGTTDEIIQWGACKWGFDEDMVRAVAVQESGWRQSTVGDNGQSFGLLQVKRTVHAGTFPASEQSTAFNVDFTLAWQRVCFEGWFEWLGHQGAAYAPGDEWGCVGAWYSGSWYDGDPAVRRSGANWYIAQVRLHRLRRTWQQDGF